MQAQSCIMRHGNSLDSLQISLGAGTEAALGRRGDCRPQGLPGLSEGGILPSPLVIGPQGWLSPSGGWCSSRGVLRVPKQSDSVCLVVHAYCYSNRIAPGTMGSRQNDQDSLQGCWCGFDQDAGQVSRRESLASGIFRIGTPPQTVKSLESLRMSIS